MADTKSKRRRHPRYKINALVDITGSEVLLYQKIKNFSIGGVCIQTPALEEVGTRVELVINIPGGGALALQGEVVWASREPPAEMGIRYLNVDAKKLEKLKQLVALTQARMMAE